VTEDRAAHVTPAWRELEAFAVAARKDWELENVHSALLAAHTAGWPFDRAAREMWRLVWDRDGSPAELRNTVRAERPRPSAGHMDPEAKAAFLAAVQASPTNRESEHYTEAGDERDTA
jgi:hypothetical protein